MSVWGADRSRGALVVVLVLVLVSAAAGLLLFRPWSVSSTASDPPAAVTSPSASEPPSGEDQGAPPPDEPEGGSDRPGFRVGTFNVLGHGHTAPGGDRTGWASGTRRMAWAVLLVRRARLDVVGFQEFQGPQQAAFRRLTGGRWDLHPDASRAGRSAQNAIAWRTAEWRLRATGSVDVPYFFGRIMPMPYVRLRHLDSGTDVWFLNVHNPADKFGDAARWRKEALAAEAALVTRLQAGGDPVVVTGDFNDREKAFCTMTARGLRASVGGGSQAGGCAPPSVPRIDWIFATEEVSLRDHVRVATGLVQRTSDHALVHAWAVLPKPATG